MKSSILHTTLFGLSVLFFSLAPAQSAIRAGDKVTVNFNSKKDNEKFIDVRSDKPLNPNIGSKLHATTGIAGSGCIEVANVGTGSRGANLHNDLVVYFAPGGLKSESAKIILNAGETLSMGIDFKVSDPNSKATARLGIVSRKELLKRTENGRSLDIVKGKDTLGGGPVSGIAMAIVGKEDKNFNVLNVIAPQKNFIKSPKSLAALKKGAWYHYTLKIFKSSIIGRFDVSISLSELNAQGEAIKELAQYSTEAINPDFYRNSGYGGLAGFTFTNDEAGVSLTKKYDNLYIEIKKGNQVGQVVASQSHAPQKTSSRSKSARATILGLGGFSVVLVDH